jgi:hypothetical protein
LHARVEVVDTPGDRRAQAGVGYVLQQIAQAVGALHVPQKGLTLPGVCEIGQREVEMRSALPEFLREARTHCNRRE